MYWVSNPGPLTYQSGAIPTALRGPANDRGEKILSICKCVIALAHIGTEKYKKGVP